MLNYKYISINKNLIEQILKLPVSGKCLYLFPTRKSLKETLKLFLPNWDLSQQRFLTMDEWKESFLLSERPLLKEEKRTLALYQSLHNEAKTFYKIDNYHQSIEFSHNFFSFWEEVREEKLDVADIRSVLEEKLTAEDWQMKCFQQLCKVKQHYLEFLEKTGFADNIFLNYEPRSQLEEYSEIYVVNQFYFTGQEKDLLLEFPGKVTIVTQIPEEFFNEDSISIDPQFKADSVRSYFKETIPVLTATDQIEMITQLSSRLHDQESATIVDFRFGQQPYSHLLDPELFNSPQERPFTATRIYRFWQSIKAMLDSFIWEGKPFLISLESLLKLASSDDLLRYFISDPDNREEFRNFLFLKIDNDIHYLDPEIILPREMEHKTNLETIFNFLQKVIKINDIGELIELVTADRQLAYLLSDNPAGSDLPVLFLEASHDFLSIETTGIFKWNQIFPNNKASNLLQLYLNYLKAKKIPLKSDKSAKYTITTLQNSRNLAFHNLHILNVVEGILPDRKHSQFLFSENQRSKLGLKTYDDITLRDKFYFYRLIACSKNVCLYTRNNLEQNVEISSFLEELKLAGAVNMLPPQTYPHLQSKLAGEVLTDRRETTLPDKAVSADFFRFPYKKEAIPDGQMIISFYKWEKMIANPFEYYLEYIKNLRKRDPEISEDLSPKAIGNIGHDIINLIWKRLIEQHGSETFSHDFSSKSQDFVSSAIKHYVEYDRLLPYISPHNYSQNYFRNIFLDILAAGAISFLKHLHYELDLSNRQISAFPETGASTLKEYFNFDDIAVFLKGRPDLRLVTEDHKYLFDYKTGNSERSKARRYDPQLQFYEMLSYGYDSLETPDKITSCLYFIEQMDLCYIQKRIDLKGSIQEALKFLKENGYTLAAKADQYEDLEITRRDLITGGADVQ